MKFIELHEGITESDNPVAGAITRRILLQRTDLLSKYGPVLVMQAIDEVADFVGDVEEIGSSDVSGWIRQVEQMLANNPPEAFGEGGVPSAPSRAVDAKGRSQQQWLQAVRSQFPNARIIQAKMIDGPIQAILPDGRKLSWSKAEQVVNTRNPSFANEEQDRSSAIDPNTKCKTCGTPYQDHFRFDNNGKILSSLVRHPQMKDDFPGMAGMSFNKPGVQTTGSSPRPSASFKRLEVGATIGYVPKVAGTPTGKIVKAEVLEIGGMIGRSAVRVKLLDPQDIAANGGKLTAIISQFQVSQNPYSEGSMNEDFEDMPDELMDPQAWKNASIREKYKALVDARLVKGPTYSHEKAWMNNTPLNVGSTNKYNPERMPTDDDMPYDLKRNNLDLNKIYRTALTDYQGRKHSSDLTSQERDYELNLGAEGRSELKRKADELAEMRREKLRQEKLHDEETAFQRAETVQQREDEMKKIADQYKHELTVIDKEHSNNMEAIKTSNKFELEKLDKEYADAQRERNFKGSETDKEYADAQREREFKSGESDKEFRDRNADRDFRAGESDKEFRDRNKDREFKSGESDKDYKDRQREREHQQSMADKEREQSRPEPEKEPRPRPQRPRPEARPRPEPTKPSKPEPQTWHTNQQVGSTAKDDEDDIEDVESRPFTPYTPRPSKPMALSAPKRESRFSEAGRYGSNNPDTMSASNYDRYQQDQMDQGKRDFKRREHEHEWEQEKSYTKQLQAQDRGPWYIRIDGKIYRQGGQPKSFDWKKGANNYALAMVKNNPSLQGKVMLSKNSEDK